MVHKFTICVCALLLLATIPAIIGHAGSAEAIPQHTRNGYTMSEPFRINSNADFAASPKVTGGNGSAGNPWIIENYEIDGTGHGYCIYIGNTTDYFVVRNCHLHDADGNRNEYFWNAGLALYNAQNGNISFNIANSKNGIYLRSSDRNVIIGNNASGNSYGIFLASSSDNTIMGNTFANQFRGIALQSSDRNTIVGNTVSKNRFIPLAFGIHLSYSGVNTVFPQAFGIHLSYSDDNTVFHNNFIDNLNQAHDDTGTNNWDNGYPGGGNYWSDYNGTDNMNGPGQDIPGSDGIGDTPFIVIQGDSGAQDNYPLMEPFTPSDAGGGDEKTPGFTFLTVLAAALIALCLINLNGRRKRTPPGI